MKFILPFVAATTLLFSFQVPAMAQKQNTNCLVSDYSLSLTDLFLRTITPTEVSIEAEGRYLCADGIVTGRNEGGAEVTLIIEEGQMICIQTGKEERLAAARATRELYYIRGQFVGIQNGAVILTGCDIQHYTTL